MINIPKTIDITELNKENIKPLIDELVYSNYRYNRIINPQIKPERYKILLDNVEEMELRYTAERN